MAGKVVDLFGGQSPRVRGRPFRATETVARGVKYFALMHNQIHTLEGHIQKLLNDFSTCNSLLLLKRVGFSASASYHR